MKALLKNPVLYYIAVPVLVGLWPILVAAVYLPQAKADKQTQIELYKKGQDIIEQIRTLDPDRLKLNEPNGTEVTFTYDVAVNQIAVLCNMTGISIYLKPYYASDNRRPKNPDRQSRLKAGRYHDICKIPFADSDSLAGLQCTNLKMDTKENLPDVWDITIDFKYYY